MAAEEEGSTGAEAASMAAVAADTVEPTPDVVYCLLGKVIKE